MKKSMESILMLQIFLLLLIKSILALQLSLDGNDWLASNQNQSIKLESRVPGSIFTDLMRNGLLKEDPYYGQNDLNYKWVSYENWTFDKTFIVDETLLSKRGIYLVCHGLDTVSQIFINGFIVGSSDNMFVRYKFDIKPYLKKGSNTIKVAFESAVTYAKRKHDEQVPKYIIPPECSAPAQKGECHSNYIRKMQASFSWDWGPSFPTQGIWKHIEIEAYNTAIIRDINVNTIRNNNHWIVNTTIHIESTYYSLFQGLLQFSIYDSMIYANNFSFKPSPDGSVRVDLQIPINDSIVIHEWYPNGLGSQMLYKMKTSLITSEEQFSKTLKIGFRTIELIQEEIKPSGLTFYFRVNGIPFYAKGSNWIPAHVFQELLTVDYIQKLLQSSKDANMNMLRVWGGGVYETDEFYEIADELGIMIWQDFMFACALYPTNDQFLASVKKEVIQQVRRLQHHPSIALWAGNNENEAAIAQYWWPEIAYHGTILKQDYVKLYIENIKVFVQNEDNSRPFLSSSPSNGLESMKEGWLARNPQDNRFGDVHYYNYGSTSWDWTLYPSAKFASEYGFQSYPSLKTLSKAVQSSDLRYPLSDVMIRRQHHANGDQEMIDLIDNYLKLPIAGGIERLDDLIYLSQIAQAMSIKTETEFYRRNRDIDPSSGEGFTMGALYWQLNDIWQAPTWASIEFGGKWKILHYFAKHMFQNLLISPYEENRELKVAVIRDDYSGILSLNMSIKVYNWSSLNSIYEFKKEIITHSFSSHVEYRDSIFNILRSANCVDRNHCVIQVIAENIQNNLRSNNFMLLNPLKNAIGLIPPNLRIKSITGPNFVPPNYIYDIVLETDGIAPFVWLDFKLNSTIEGIFSDNGFVMFSNEKSLQFYSTTPLSIDKLKTELTIKSLTDVKSE